MSQIAREFQQECCRTSDNKILFEYGHKQRFNRRGHQVPLYHNEAITSKGWSKDSIFMEQKVKYTDGEGR